MTLKEYLQNEYSKTSKSGYENMINRFLLWVESKADKATYTDILEYIGLLREQNLHPKSSRNNLFAIKIYYNYLIKTGKCKDHPCRLLYLKDQINRAIQIEALYPKEALENLFETWQSRKTEHQTRDKIIISLLVYQPLLVLEIVQIKVSDINLENGTIKIKGNKKNKGQMKKIKSCFNSKHSNKKVLHSNRHHRSAYARKKTGEATEHNVPGSYSTFLPTHKAKKNVL